MKILIKFSILSLAVALAGSAYAGRDGSGNYSLPAGNPVTTGTTITSTWANNTLSDIATALTNSIAKDGQTTPTADLPMGGYKHTNVGDANARNQYPSVSQVQDFELQTLANVSGTDTIIGGLVPAITDYTTGMLISFVPANTNTGAATLAINGLSARDIVKYDGDALVAGDLVKDIPAIVVASATDFVLLNPQSATLINGVAISDLVRLSQSNTITGETLTISHTAPKLEIIDSDATANRKRIRLQTGSSTFAMSAVSDDGATSNPFLSLTTTGTASPSVLNLQATTVQANGNTIWHAGNDGTGSGLDADTLDGQQASAFAAASHNHSASQITSGTLPVSRGGTGTTTSTGSGSVVLSASPTLSGTITGGTFSGTHTGNGSGLTSLNASNLASGTVPSARISAESVTQHMGAGYARNITNKTGVTKTLSSSAPSGGSDGDIWYRY